MKVAPNEAKKYIPWRSLTKWDSWVAPHASYKYSSTYTVKRLNIVKLDMKQQRRSNKQN